VAAAAAAAAGAAGAGAGAGASSSSGSRGSFDEDVEWARVMRTEVQRVMWGAAGIVRNTATLRRAQEELEVLLGRCEVEMQASGAGLYAHELRNLITVVGLYKCVVLLQKVSATRRSMGTE
jgi:L-aspartate oxidase